MNSSTRIITPDGRIHNIRTLGAFTTDEQAQIKDGTYPLAGAIMTATNRKGNLNVQHAPRQAQRT